MSWHRADITRKSDDKSIWRQMVPLGHVALNKIDYVLSPLSRHYQGPGVSYIATFLAMHLDLQKSDISVNYIYITYVYITTSYDERTWQISVKIQFNLGITCKINNTCQTL